MKIRGKNINMVDRRLKGESRKHYLNYLRKEYQNNFPYDKEKDSKIIYDFKMNRAIRKMEEKSYDFYFTEDGINFKVPTIMDTLKYAFKPKKSFKEYRKDIKNSFDSVKNKTLNFIKTKFMEKNKNKLDTIDDFFEDEEYLEENLKGNLEVKEKEQPTMGIEIKSSKDLTKEEQYLENLKKLKEEVSEMMEEHQKYMEETSKKFQVYEQTLNRLRKENLKLRKDYKELAINSKSIIIRNNELELERKNKINQLNEMYDQFLINSGRDYKNNNLAVNELDIHKVKILTR